MLFLFIFRVISKKLNRLSCGEGSSGNRLTDDGLQWTYPERPRSSINKQGKNEVWLFCDALKGQEGFVAP
jgi:hypothetical protein